MRTHKADPANNPPPGPAIKPENLPSVAEIQAQPPSDISKDFISIEEKVDMLLKQQEERRKAEENALQEAMDPANTKSKSTRERLDDLLRLYIHGKITQAEYNEQRKAIITENK